MFKIESYITPILISYVEKYIKNLKAEDSQVSLWGGDATFHNLDLRLDVLEKELQLPFSLVSGHIHELSIHVPWTKLASEPISITINTIECVLKLRGSGDREEDSAQYAKKRSNKNARKQNAKQDQIEAPPGYVQSLINKIVNNITINCKNLILKYVEEDIVVSVNIKLLTFESANENWVPAFTEISPVQVIMRKLIKLSDLTVCLDKRNASGKIEVYQEPMLYRCFVEIRLLRNYHGSSSKKASTTRLDVYCNKMEFSMTEQQIPMLMRMIMLLLALHQRQLKSTTDLTELASGSDGEDSQDVPSDSWSTWMWRAVGSLLPAEEPDNDWSAEQQHTYRGHTLHTGFYIDHATFTFKVSEYSNGRGYYTTRKLKYWPLLCLELNGCFLETIANGVEWFNAKIGVSEAILTPQGHCTCGYTEVFDENQAPCYLKSGSRTESHKIDSLFDRKSPENLNDRKVYCTSLDYHLAVHTEAALLERTPAFAIDYLYKLEIPDDFSSDRLSELGSDLEYSNLSETSLCRLVGGPVTILLCSGLIHRMDTLRQVAAAYDYQPYSNPPPIPNLNELHPPSEDDFDALNNDIPLRTYQFTFFKPVLEFQLMDHPKFTSTKNYLFKKRKNLTNTSNNLCLNYPKVTLECECIDAKLVNPMYPKRLVFTTCQLPTAPTKMFNSCYKVASGKIVGLGSRLIFGNNKHTTVLMPSNVKVDFKNILFPKFWINPDIIHEEISVEIESLTLTGTKSKFMVIQHVMDKFFKMDAGDFRNSIFMTSLLQDCCKDSGMVVLELYIEELKAKKVKTISTVTYDISLNYLKAFILEAGNEGENINLQNKLPTLLQDKIKQPDQVLIISGPEANTFMSSTESFQDGPLLTATFQYPLDLNNHIHPPLLLLNIAEVKICVDPLLFTWLLYTPRNLNFRPEHFWNQETVRRNQLSEASGSLQETPRRIHTPHESVHSSSDKELSTHLTKTVSDTQENVNINNSFYDFMLEYYSVWTSIVLFGNISQCTVYFPTQSLTAVGFQGIQEAVEMSLKRESPPEIMVVKLPHCSIRSASQRKDLAHYVNRLPVKLPESMWQPLKMSFPWSFSIWDFCCYTLQNDSKLNFLKPLSGNATIGLSVKNRTKKEVIKVKDIVKEIESKLENKKIKHGKYSDCGAHSQDTGRLSDNISSLGVCVHIDNTPVVISISDTQLHMMSNVVIALHEVLTQKNILKKHSDVTPPCIQKSRSQSPNLFKESTAESLSERTPTNVLSEQDADVEEEEIKLTAWMQWTIARLSLKLYTHDLKNDSKFSYLMPPTLKLVFDMEDIMSSLDLQKVYMKFKSKIVTATINHYKRENVSKPWETGDYLGFIMRGQEGIPSTERQDDCGFMSLTVTRAKCGHVHSKWGTSSKKYKLAEAKIDTSIINLDTRYISEVVVTLQPIDLLMSFSILRNFYVIFDPLKYVPVSEAVKSTNSNTCLDNSKLPLAYLECHGLRVMIPVSDLDLSLSTHDVVIFEVSNIHLTPMADNPICRTPVRPDIYQQAAQARILNVPGSEVEDRQYQLNISCLTINTGLWYEFSETLTQERSSVNLLHTMSENPALEWNNLGGKINASPHLILLPIIKKFDLCFVFAPAIIYKNNSLVCGSSVEINFVSDIDMTVSLCQIRLLSTLSAEFLYFFEPNQKYYSTRQKFSYVSNKNDELKDDFDIFIDYTKDSGIELVDINSEITIKTKESEERKLKVHSELTSERSPAFKFTPINPTTSLLNYCPMDILVAGGEISVCLYKIKYFNSRAKYLNKSHKKKSSDTEPHLRDRGYEASEEGSVDETNLKHEMQPLVFILFAQPNMFFSRATFGNKLNFSCFDVCFKVSGPEYKPTSWIPTINDFPLNLLETKSGTPDPDTGIPPAFLTLKLVQGIGKTPSLSIEFDRPIKITYCLVQWCYLLHIKDKIMSIIEESCEKLLKKLIVSKQKTEEITVQQPNQSSEVYSQYRKIKKMFHGLHTVNAKFAQLVFEVKTDSGPEIMLSIAKWRSGLTLTNRPERIAAVVNMENLSITCMKDGSRKILLNPWSCNFDISTFWESWQNADSDPQIQFTVESDCFVMDIGPEQLKTVESVTKEIRDLKNCFQSSEESYTEQKWTSNSAPERDQHYKDDLRAGAFQFVEATGTEDELPLPYQVMFWNDSVSAMAWRYPQPRVLTKVRVFPVPFKITHEVSKEQRVLCNLEYWSDCHGSYQSYTQFQLSESEMCQLDLPKDCPRPAVSCTWRVVLSVIDKNDRMRDTHRVLVEPRALAACMRIDSYFNPLLVPKIQIAMKLNSFAVQLYNQFRADLAVTMPETLSGYTPDGLLPNNQCFLVFSIENSTIYLATWSYDTAMFDLSSSVRCDILEYSCLTQEPFILPFSIKITMNIADNITFNVVSKSIQTKFSPSIGHTLAVSAQIWEQTWNLKSYSEPPELIISTRYVICNNTNYNLRFGQAGTEEDILLPSRYLHMYAWRSQKFNQKIRLGLEQNGWLWSKALDIDEIRSELFEINSENKFTLIVTVKSLSASQKQVIFSGQLIICNMLSEHFEMKLVPAVCDNRDAEFRAAPNHIITGKSLAPSLIVNLKQKLCLRLRFYGLESAWSGDIPLEENTKCAQPWLVKVPLQERGQFLSIWCRILDQNFEKEKRIMVLLWPLFMVRSNLPVSAEVHIETPVLNVNVETVIRGRGELQQLYCPGTIDHSHQLTFQLDSETPVSNPYVPLNYSLVDQKLFFKKPEKHNMDDIVEVLKKFGKSDWPYIDRDENIEWIAEDQPLTHVQVHYQNACEYSSSLLVELLPWCLFLNTLGCDVAIIANNGRELCRTRHSGVVTPPKLENTFQISVGIGETWNISPVLQLAKPDWSQSFYKPKINGIIPMEGNIHVPIMCENGLCVANITSNISKEILVLEIASSHVLTNDTSLQLHVACIALPDDGKSYHIPTDIGKYSFTLAPNLNTNHVGVPIIHWYAPYEISDSFTGFTLHIMFSLERKNAWSCPVRVDKGLIRRSISICSSSQNIPMILVAQENKGQVYLSINHDSHPQLLIENKCTARLLCIQSSNDEIIKDNQFLNWMCIIPPESEAYYTLPTVGAKFPEITSNGPENILIAVPSSTDEPVWSQPVDVNNHNEQYLRIPKFGDVKLIIKKIIYTILIRIVSITEIEISAGDIRSRLTFHENQVKNMIENSPQKKDVTEEESKNVVVSKMGDVSCSTLGSIYYSTTDIASVALSQTSTRLSKDDSGCDCTSTAVAVRTNWCEVNSKTTKEQNYVEKPADWSSFSANIFIEGFVIQLLSDAEESGFEQREIAMLSCDNIVLTSIKNSNMKFCISASEIQLDNQLYNKSNYDFPVLLIRQERGTVIKLKNLNIPVKKLIHKARRNALVMLEAHVDRWYDKVTEKQMQEIRDIKISAKPIALFIEDKYISKLLETFANLVPTTLVMWPKYKSINNFNLNSTLSLVNIPQDVTWESRIISRPVILQNLCLEPVSILLSVHSSVKLYIALDRSPIHFGRFERKNIVTTPYSLGHALTMHYISGAIFASGWVLGSLELLGSPGGLARSLGSGLRDFISLPYHGFIQGPWAFILGITHGSASLMKHVTAGTLHSVTKMASSVARNLDRLTMDEEHLQRTEELRRHKPQGLGQGLVQGLTGLGISLLGAVGGIAHHPLQSVMKEGVSPRGLATGVGLGLVGVLTKPLSGAAELVALTGQGLLQGAGWNPLPEPRTYPTAHHMFTSNNSVLKYKWKFLHNLTAQSNLFAATEATLITLSSEYIAVALVLTNEALVIFNTDEDSAQRVVHLNEIIGVDTTSDPTLIAFNLKPPAKTMDDPLEMDPACRERVANYVRNSASLMHLPSRDSSPSQSDIDISPIASFPNSPVKSSSDSPKLCFYVNPQFRNYFYNMLALAKQQSQDNTFRII